MARLLIASSLSLSLIIPCGTAFAAENTQHGVLPHLDPRNNLMPSGQIMSNPPSVNLESLLQDKLASNAKSEEANTAEGNTEPSPEEIRQQTIAALIDTALSLQGTPYWYGGTTPEGFDCSGFTQYVFAQTGAYELPRTAAEQSYCGTPVSFDELSAGDLVFWDSGYGVYHTGIYLGDWSYIHADCDRGITVASMDSFTPSSAMRVL